MDTWEHVETLLHQSLVDFSHLLTSAMSHFVMDKFDDRVLTLVMYSYCTHIIIYVPSNVISIRSVFFLLINEAKFQTIIFVAILMCEIEVTACLQIPCPAKNKKHNPISKKRH